MQGQLKQRQRCRPTKRLPEEDAFSFAARSLAEKTFLVPFSDCHYFTGAIDGRGYGQIGYPSGCRYQAHRLAYEIANGPIPKGDGYHGTEIMHTCDTPSCVNPAHLVAGTHRDNMLDKERKGRGGDRTCRNNPKLSEDDVRAIRRMSRRGVRRLDIHQRFSHVSLAHIESICRGRARVAA